MSEEARVAMANAAIARAMIQAMAMQAENQLRAHQGLAPAYTEASFVNLIELEGISHNQIIDTLQGR